MKTKRKGAHAILGSWDAARVALRSKGRIENRILLMYYRCIDVGDKLECGSCWTGYRILDLFWKITHVIHIPSLKSPFSSDLFAVRIASIFT